MEFLAKSKIQPLRRDPITQMRENRAKYSTAGRWVSADFLWRFYRDRGGWRIAAVGDSDYDDLSGKFFTFSKTPYAWRRDLLRNHKLNTHRFETLKEAVWLIEQVLENLDGGPSIDYIEAAIAAPNQSEIDVEAIAKIAEEATESRLGSL